MGVVCGWAIPPPIFLQASTLGFEDWGPIFESPARNLESQASTTMIRVRGLRPDARTLSPKPRPQAQNLDRVRGFQPETSNPRPQTLNPKPKTSNPRPKTLWGSWFSTRNLEPYAANPEPQAQNLESQTPNFEPQPQNRKIVRKSNLFEAFPR